MKSITNCPNCQTQFLVTDEQLSQFNGKVRCGNCLTIFNAVEHFVVSSEIEIPDRHDKDQEINLEALTTDTIDAIDTTQAVEQDLPSPEYLAAFGDTPNADFSIDSSQQALDFADILKENLNTTINLNEDESNKVDEDAFDYRPHYHQHFSKKKSSSSGLIIFGLCLAFLAITQSIYFFREDIVIDFPSTKPIFSKICEQFGCTIKLPKKIEQISVDDSNIQEDQAHPGLIHLSTTLTNHAIYDQAYPNLELTLTDTDEKPILRRIFKPADYLPAQTNIAAGISTADSVSITMSLMTEGVKLAGYRVFVTY